MNLFLEKIWLDIIVTINISRKKEKCERSQLRSMDWCGERSSHIFSLKIKKTTLFYKMKQQIV